jgi:hypothetical protein
MTARRLTMADVRALNLSYHSDKGDGFSYFDRGNTRLFGPEKFYGPYVGPGGTFFVQNNKTGVNVKQVRATGEIVTVNTNHLDGFDAKRTFARHLAKTPVGI